MIAINLRKAMIVTLAVAGLTVLAAFRLNSYASAATAQDQICAGLGAADGGSGCSDSSDSPTLSNTVTAAINILSLVIGAAAIVMIVIGGLKYVSSQGDSSGIASAKNTIIYALVGIIIVALAQVMVHFVIARVANTNESRNSTSGSRPR